ncbi:hypothetical protein ACFQO1_03225 [Jejudonia soesokkakensis]|uniref:DUF748 domain-containing protein n=1 Tax=Jejudonia soesokkakensis TaxID=1323432 RepID=A0ABW2MP75_9FLAO
MSKTLRWIISSIGAIIIIGLLATMYINYTVKNKVENFLATQLPSNISQSYKRMNLDVLRGTITIFEPSVVFQNKKDNQQHTFITLDKIIIEEVSYWDYLFNEEIHIEDIKLKSPVITYYKDRLITSTDTVRKAPIRLYKPVIVDELSIDNTTLKIIDATKDSIFMYAENLTIEIDDILVTSETLKRRLPLEFSEYEAETDSVFLKVSPYENVSVGDLKLKDKKLAIQKINLRTKYSRQQLSNILSVERDHFDIDFNSLTASEIDFGFKNNRLFVNVPQILFEDPKAVIYRNKLLADDPKIKPLYSKMLRDLNFDLTVDEIEIKNGAITYTERVKADNSGGTINFSNLFASIYNASNTYPSGTKTQIDIKAEFMENTPFNVNWEFDVTNTADQFLFKAEIGSLAAAELNKFTQPNLKVKLEGMTNKTYFTISGDNNTSMIDMRMNYDDFKVSILGDNGRDKKGFVSAIANLFIKKDSDNEENSFREGSGNATRNKTKSFFNYLWLNTESGLKATLTGGSNSTKETSASRSEKRKARRATRARS